VEHDCTCATVFSRACTHLLPGGHAIYKLLDVNAVVRTGRIFCSGASNSSAPSVPPSDKPFSFVATEAQLDGFTSTVTDMALAVPTLHRSLRVPVLSHDNLDYCERGSVSSYKIAGIDNTLHTAPMDRPEGFKDRYIMYRNRFEFYFPELLAEMEENKKCEYS
jgi:hypothetical protein